MLLLRFAGLITVLVLFILVWRSPLFLSSVAHNKLKASTSTERHGGSVDSGHRQSYLPRPVVPPQHFPLFMSSVPHNKLKASTSTERHGGSVDSGHRQLHLPWPVVAPQDKVSIPDGDPMDPHEINISAKRGRCFSAVTSDALASWGWGRDEENAGRYFNQTRCKQLTVFFYPEPICKPSQMCLPIFKYFRHGDILPTALHGESWRVTDKPKEACIFLLRAVTAKRQDQREQLQDKPDSMDKTKSFYAAGEAGMNHVYISGGDKGERWKQWNSMMQAWPSASRPGNYTKCYSPRMTPVDPQTHRIGFDVPFPNLPFSISKPLACELSRKACNTFKMQDRNISKARPILSFWVGTKGTCPRLRSRVLEHLHNSSRKMIAVTPSAKKIKGMALESKFLLAPTGDGRGSSYRLIESLSAGAVPLYIGATLEPPFSETLPFEDYAMYFHSKKSLKKVYGYMKEKLSNCNRSGQCEWHRLQSNAIWVYEHYFASDVRAVAGLLELLGRRIRGHLKPVTPTGGYFKTAPGFCMKMAQLERELEKRGNLPPKGGFPVDREC